MNRNRLVNRNIRILIIVGICFAVILNFVKADHEKQVFSINDRVKYEAEKLNKNSQNSFRRIYVDSLDKELQYKLAMKKSKENNTKAHIKKDEIDEELLKLIKYDVCHEGETVENYERSNQIVMENWQSYSDIEGVTCFRGNNYRNSASYGSAHIKDKKLEIIWDVPIGATDRWTGVGWNGQPAIVKWPEKLREKMNIFEEKRRKENLKEVIYGTLDRNIYFLDLEDGEFTREEIKIPGPVKGSVTVDPRGLPLLYVGQGINSVNGKWVEMGYRIFSLLDSSLLFFIDGGDSFAYREWSAFDSTSIIDKRTDTMLVCGENGIFYTVKLNSNYNQEKNEITINPKITKYRYKIDGNYYQGIESSIAVYRNLAFFADNGGWIQCVDLNKMVPLWIFDSTDDTDSTIVIEEEGKNNVALYTGCEVDKQGTKGISYIRKLDAFSGRLIWERTYECYSKLGQWPNNGGVLSTPAVGRKSISNMVIYSIARCGGFNKGLVVALDKETGQEIWRLNLDNYSWSSPVDIYTEDGEAYILICDSGGNVFLLEGTTGKILDSICLGANVEGSPAVFENIAVVGTRGQRIFGIKIH